MKHNRIKIHEQEPRWCSEKDENQLCEMLNWYSYNKNTEDAQKYFLEYLRIVGEKEEIITQISECSTLNLKNSIGWLSRIKLVNGENLPEKFSQRLEDEKNAVLKIVAGIKATTDEHKKTKLSPNKLTVRDHLENQLHSFLSDLSVEFDKFVLQNYSTDFKTYDWLKSQDVKHQHAKNIADYYQKNVLAELEEALAGNCPQLKEAYAFMGKSGIKKTIEFVRELIDACVKWSDVAKQISLNNRAPRVKKPKPAAKQVEKLKFMREHENLKSIPATQIVGATQLWIYNTKTRTLGVYVCNNLHGFSVKGSTILNYEASESISKKLRKPEDILPKVLEAGKIALRKILPNIRAKEKKLTGRINKDTILLKVV